MDTPWAGSLRVALFLITVHGQPSDVLAGQAMDSNPRGGAIAQTGARAVTLDLIPRQQEIELAVGAAPGHLRKDATVYVFGRRGYERAREGTNGFTCLVNRDGAQAGDRTLRPTCWDREGGETIVPVVLRVGELLARGESAEAIRRDIEAGYRDGRFREPRRAGIAYMLSGDVEQFNRETGKIESRTFPPHYMIYAPGVTNADIGMSAEAHRADASLPVVYRGYSGGGHTAYIIVLAAGQKGHLDH